MEYFRNKSLEIRKRRNIGLSSFCLVLFFLFFKNGFTQNQLEHLNLNHQFYIAADRYKDKQLVTGITIDADSMGFYKVKVDLLLNWKTKHTNVYNCQLDTTGVEYYFKFDSLNIPAIRIFDSVHQLEILIKKPVKQISYTANKEEMIYWISEIAAVNLPEPFYRYWKREVIFHEK